MEKTIAVIVAMTEPIAIIITVIIEAAALAQIDVMRRSSIDNDREHRIAPRIDGVIGSRRSDQTSGARSAVENGAVKMGRMEPSCRIR